MTLWMLPGNSVLGQKSRVQEVLERALDAQGGRERIEKIQDVFVKIGYRTFGKADVDGELHEYWRHPDQIRVEWLEMEEPSLVRVYDGKLGRFCRIRGGTTPGPVRPVEGEDLLQLLDFMRRLKIAMVRTLLTEGEAKLLRTPPGVQGMHFVKWSDNDDETLIFRIDDGEYRIRGVEIRKKSGERFTVDFERFQPFDGVTLPTEAVVYRRVSRKEPPEKVLRAQILDVRFDLPIEEEHYQNPARPIGS